MASPFENPMFQELLKAGGKVMMQAGAKAAARALDSVLEDGAKVIAEGSRRVKKARSRLRRYENDEPRDPPVADPPEDDG